MDVLGTLFVLGLTFVVGFMFTAVAVSVLALVVGLFVRGGHFPAKTVFTLSIVLALGQTIVSGVELFREQLSRDMKFPAVGGHDLSRRWCWSLVGRLGFHLFESEALAVDVDDVAVVEESVEDGCGEDFVAG